MEQEKSIFGEFETEEEFLDCITDEYEIYESEGLEEVYLSYMKLPLEKRTAKALEKICKDFQTVDFNQYDPPPWLHNV